MFGGVRFCLPGDGSEAAPLQCEVSRERRSGTAAGAATPQVACQCINDHLNLAVARMVETHSSASPQHCNVHRSLFGRVCARLACALSTAGTLWLMQADRV